MVCQHSKGEEVPKTSRPRGVPGSLLFPLPLSFTAKNLLGRENLFCLDAGDLATVLSAKDQLGDRVPLSGYPLGEII